MNQVLWFPLLLVLYAAVSAFGLYLLKASENIQSYGFLIGVVLYGGGFVIWIFILRIYPLSVSFPAAAGSLIVATYALGTLLLKEESNLTSLAGIVLILGGIILIYTNMTTNDG